MFTRDLLDEDGLLVCEGVPVWGCRGLRLGVKVWVKVSQLASKCGQLVQRVVKSQTISPSVVTAVLISVQMVVHLVREITQIIRFLRSHRGRVEVDEQPPAVAQRARPLLQGAQHPLGRERRADDPRGQQLVASAPVVRQVAAVAAAEGAEVTLVRLLSCVRPHVGFQVALVRRGERTKLAAVRLFSWGMIRKGHNCSYDVDITQRTLL